MAGHTPGALHQWIGIQLLDDSGQVVGLVPVSTKLAPKEEAANAEHLALCWNTHDDLVAALEFVLSFVPPPSRESGTGTSWVGEKARAALAAAKGGPAAQPS